MSVGYASGDTIYKYSSEPVPELPQALTAAAPGLLDADEAEPAETETPVDIAFTVPSGAQTLVVNVWDRYAVHVARPVYEQSPKAGSRSFAWDFRDLDVEHMTNAGPFSVDLNDHAAVAGKSQQILDRLKNEDDPMPPVDDDGPWPQEWISLFERWIAEGHPA